MVVLAMGAARAGDVGQRLADFGRSRAQDSGWYSARREYQAPAVAATAAIWFLMTVGAIWRVPERRRRFLPMAIAIFTLICFAGVALVSYHDLDTVLYRRETLGVQNVALVELTLLGLALLAALAARRPDRPATLDPADASNRVAASS